MRDSGLDNEIGLYRIDDLLNTHHVFRQLDDRTTEPAKGVHILVVPAAAQPRSRNQSESFRSIYPVTVRALFCFDGNEIVVQIDFYDGFASSRRYPVC